MISGTRYQLQLEVNRQLRLATEIARGQAEISSTKKILAPSDDPVGSARVSEIARLQASQATWKSNLTTAAALSSKADSTLEAVVNAFDRASELMLRAANGTMSASDRNAAVLELRSMAEEVAVLRDSRDSRGDPLFPPAASALRLPVGPDLEISAVGSIEGTFDAVTTAGGPASLVSILNAAADAVAGGDPAAISSALAAVNAGGSHAIAARSEQGARGARIDSLLDRNAGLTLDLQEERAGVEGADIHEVVARIQAKQLSLEAAQAVFARINKSTLFDLLS